MMKQSLGISNRNTLVAVIASFTLAIAAGASPVEAAMISNHAAGVVVGKLGTATLTQEELVASFNR